MHFYVLDVLELCASLPFGPIALVALSVVTLSSLALVASAFLARRSGATKATRWLAALTLGTFSLGAFAVSRVLVAAHRSILEPPPLSPGAKIDLRWNIAIAEAHAAWALLGLALVIVAAFSGAALALLARRAFASRTVVVAAAFICLLAVVTGAGILYHFETADIHLGSFCGEFADRSRCMVEAQEQARNASSVVRVVLLALATLGSGILVALSRRNTKEAAARDPEAMLPLGAAIFAFGLAAWIGARGMAHDARHPIPLPSAEEWQCLSWMAPPASSLPPAGACNANVDAPYVVVDAGGPHVDGARAANTEELTSILKNKRELYRQITGRDLADPLVIVMAPADTPMATMLPVVAAVENGFRGHVAIVGVHPERHISTATIGAVTLHPRCCNTRLRMDPSGASLSSYATWGEVARAASEGAFFRLDP